jgi:hypothetical protein
MTDTAPVAPTPPDNQPGFNFVTTIVNDLSGWLGNADMQKIIGIGGVAFLQNDFKTWGAKLAMISVGGAFALGVHFIDWLRTK